MEQSPAVSPLAFWYLRALVPWNDRAVSDCAADVRGRPSRSFWSSASIRCSGRSLCSGWVPFLLGGSSRYELNLRTVRAAPLGIRLSVPGARGS